MPLPSLTPKVRSLGSTLTSVAVIVAWAVSPSAHGIGIVINEFRATNTAIPTGSVMATNEFIEFLITAPTTANELASLTFGDTNNATSRISSAFAFDLSTLDGVLNSAGLTEFQVGTLIVVKGTGLGAQNLSYNPLSATISDQDAWAIELVVNQGFSRVATYPQGGPMNLNTNQGDVVWIAQGTPNRATTTSGFIDALGIETTMGRIANDAVNIFGTSAILNTSVPNNGSNAVSRSFSGGAPILAAPSRGTAGTNAAEINALRLDTLSLAGIPEPTRASLLAFALLSVALRRRRSVSLSA
jgi:hypothetical protein